MCCASVAAASLAADAAPAALSVFADSGERNADAPVEEVSNASDCLFAAAPALKVRADGELGIGDLSPGDLRFMLASLASIWLCIEPPTAGLKRAVIGSDLAICCRTVMKNRIWT